MREGNVLTLWLWKLATTFSAFHFSANANSAVTAGWCETTRQLNIGPETGSMAAWMSAAIVPGAKLLPTTMNGPEAPLIDKPPLSLRTVACPLVLFNADKSCSRRPLRIVLYRDRVDVTVAGAGLRWVWVGVELADAER